MEYHASSSLLIGAMKYIFYFDLAATPSGMPFYLANLMNPDILGWPTKKCGDFTTFGRFHCGLVTGNYAFHLGMAG